MTPLQPRPFSPKYRLDIDGLRAVAILSVVGFHAFPHLVKGGFIGVDVFFVISGYLISTIIFENLHKGTFSFADFYARRVRRIFPALLIVLIASYAFGWFALSAEEYKQLGKHVVAGSGFVSNILLWSESGYFDSLAETKPLLHLWSLGIEEQFYIVWPLLLWLAWKGRFKLLTITILVAIVSFYLNIKGIRKDVVATFYSPQTRFWELLCGSLLAWITLYERVSCATIKARLDPWLVSARHREEHDAKGNTLLSLLSFLGLFILAYGFCNIKATFFFPGKWAVIPVLGAALIILAGPKAWCNRIILSNKVVVWFGLISFPLYLWHWPLLSFARIVGSEMPSRTIRAVIVVLSVGLAWLTHKIIERPMRIVSYGKTKVTALVVFMLVVGSVGYKIYSEAGFPLRGSISNFEENNRLLQWNGEDDAQSHAECMSMYNLSGPIRYCNLSGVGKPKIAIIGDSHGRALYNGLKEDLGRRNEPSLQIGGRLFLDLAVYPLGNSFEIDVYKGGIKATEFVAKEPTIETVVMVSRDPFLFNRQDAVVFQLLSKPEIKDRREILEIALRKTLEMLLTNKKKVIFVVDNPDIDFDPRSCLVRPFGKNLKSVRIPCAVSRVYFDSVAKEYRDLVFVVLKDYPKVKIFDAAAYFCDETWCWASKEGKVLYLDSNHLTLAGARMLSKELIKVIDGQESKRLSS